MGLRSLYELNSTVLPYFDYCSRVWGSCGEGMRNKLQTLQNRAARVVTSSSYDRRSVEKLDEIGCDILKIRRTRQLATIMYTLKNSTSSMYSYYLRNYTVHSPPFSRKIIEIERFVLRAAILHECQNCLGSGSDLGGKKVTEFYFIHLS